MRDYQGTTIANPIEESYAGDLPTRLLMDLTVDGSKLMDYSFAATYNNAGEPASLDISLALAAYTFSIRSTLPKQPTLTTALKRILSCW